MINLLNPFSKVKYGNKKQYRRPLLLALSLWWKWEVIPLFKRQDFIVLNADYVLYVYRWERWFSPTIKLLCCNLTSYHPLKNNPFNEVSKK